MFAVSACKDSESEDEDQTDDDSEALNSLAGHDTASVALGWHFRL